MKKPTKKLSLNTETIRNLQSDELTRVVGGSAVSLDGPSVIRPSTSFQITPSTSVISRLPSGGLPSGGSVGH